VVLYVNNKQYHTSIVRICSRYRVKETKSKSVGSDYYNVHYKTSREIKALENAQHRTKESDATKEHLEEDDPKEHLEEDDLKES